MAAIDPEKLKEIDSMTKEELKEAYVKLLLYNEFLERLNAPDNDSATDKKPGKKK